MKISKQKLKQIIREEIEKELSELKFKAPGFFQNLFNLGSAKKVGDIGDVYRFFNSSSTDLDPPFLPLGANSVYKVMKAAIKHRSENPNYVIRGAKRGCLCKDDQGNSHRFLCRGKCPDCNDPKELAIALKSKCNPQR
jgi:hypothetical protein